MEAPEYRCKENQSSINNGVNEMAVKKNRPVLSYANVTQNDHFPKKDQAIVLDAINEIPVKEYTTVIGAIVNLCNIRFVSRISNNRVCLFLADKKLVDSLVDAQTIISIRDYKLVIRLLISRAKRIILSNVCPIIPHQTIIDSLSALNVSVVSPVTFIRAGMSEPGYAHIHSFRRQVFIQPEDAQKLPENIQVNYDGTNFWVYITTDNPTCFICKKEGHLAKQCASVSQPANLIDKETNQNNGNFLMTDVKSGTKRALSSSNSGKDTSSYKGDIEGKSLDKDLQTASKDKDSIKKHSIKKVKTSLQVSGTVISAGTDDAFLPIKEVLQAKRDQYVLNYEQFKDFIAKAAGNKNIALLASIYTNDIAGLTKTLRELYPHFKERAIKNRITRIIKKLEEHISWTEDMSSGTETNQVIEEIYSVTPEDNIENTSKILHIEEGPEDESK